MPAVTVVGYLSLDQITCAAGTFEAVPGGAAAYCAAGAAAAGARVRLVAGAGEDYPQAALDALAEAGVDLSDVRRIARPARRSRLHDPSGRDRTLLHLGDAAW